MALLQRALTYVGAAILITILVLIAVAAAYAFVSSGHDICVGQVGDSWFCKLLPSGIGANDAAQLVASIVAAVMAAVAALAAAYLTARFYEHQETRKQLQERKKTALLIAADIAAFNEQFLPLLNGSRLTNEPTMRLNADPAKLSQILPAQTTYERLLARIADFNQDAVHSVAQFYAQVRRSQSMCAAGPVNPMHLGHLVRRMSKALLDLQAIVPLPPRTIAFAHDIFSRLQMKNFQDKLWNEGESPLKLFGKKFVDETGWQIRRWADLATANPWIKDEEDDWA
jgi:hypothetical protein